MSRSNPTDGAQNPATRFFDWQGGDGTLTWYDKEKKENVAVELPFRFLVLDEVATVGGGIDHDGTYIGYWSNAIRPMEAKVSPFIVRSSVNGKTRVEYEGIWADVKAKLPGAKYVKGLYIAYYNDNGDLDIGYLKIRGASASAWREFTLDHKNIYSGAFSITGNEKKKKGTNTYYEPVFGHTDKVKEETNEWALTLDKDILQPYLTTYFAQQKGVAQAAAVGGEAVEYSGVEAPMADAINSQVDDDDDIPF